MGAIGDIDAYVHRWDRRAFVISDWIGGGG